MTKRLGSSTSRPTGERGVALVTALVFLLLLTVIGVTAMRTATVQERMAGNARDRNVAFQAAEETLREGEDAVESGVSTTESAVHGPGDGPDWSSLVCASSSEVAEITATATVVSDPCYFMEQRIKPNLVPGEPAELRYLITAVAKGRSPKSRVVLRSAYKD